MWAAGVVLFIMIYACPPMQVRVSLRVKVRVRLRLRLRLRLRVRVKARIGSMLPVRPRGGYDVTAAAV